MKVNFAMMLNPFGDHKQFISVQIGRNLHNTLINMFKYGKSLFSLFQKI